MDNPLMVIGCVVAFILFLMFLSYIPFGALIQSWSSGIRISPWTLFEMRLRGTPAEKIVDCMIMSHNANLPIQSKDLEAHYLAGGAIGTVVHALIQAQKAKIKLDFTKACGIDLAGRDVLEAVNMCVNPKVIKTPLIGAVAKDGIQLKAMARITVKASIEKLIGGAGEATIIARVGEGICTTIGSAVSHKKVLESPGMISQVVESKGLDVGTAFSILSIDIADVDVGKNIGSELQIQQANADKNIAQAKAEQRRAIAIAEEAEMKAKVVEMEAKVIYAEAHVPLALASALREGKMGKSVG